MHPRLSCSAATAIVVAARAASCGQVAVVVVDPHAPPGEAVVSTLEQAVAWVALHKEDAEQFEIRLTPGLHEVRHTVRFPPDLPPLRIEGSGARLVGGVVIATPDWVDPADPAILARLPDPSGVRALVLPPEALAGWSGGLSGPVHRGMGHGVSAVRTEFFVAGHALTPARWPDQGFAPVAGILDPGSTPRNAGDDIPESERVHEPPRGGTFLLGDADRAARWAGALAAGADLWAEGYWWWDWADEQIPIASIDAATGAVTLALPHTYGLRDTARFYVTNLPEELDAPGEYWIDPGAGVVYAWLPEGAAHAEAALSMLDGPMLECTGGRGVTIDGPTFEYGRGGAIVATGVDGLEIRGCTFRNLGAQAVRLDGKGSAIRRCLFEEVGGGGVALSGGDRATLTHADNTVEDCAFRRCGRVLRTYNPAISLSGVGQRVAHNEIADLPHIAIMFGGNEHMIEANHIHHVVQETGDAGAIYCGRDWTIHGTVIRGNLFHDIAGSDARYQNAVYLDDMASGLTVEGNLFIRCNWGMLVGGGRDNTIRNNAFVSCGMAIHYDARGVGWMAKSIADPATSTLHKNLAAVPIDHEPWKSRYPMLATYLTDRFGRPVGGVFEGNALINTPLGNIDDRECVRVIGNITLTPDVASAEADALIAAVGDGVTEFDLGEAVPGFPPIAVGRAGPSSR
ncbi:MAG: right-handed parallel beta-helix repeat-containing protein [Phycisphaerales bacterium]|nr:right-handed parallel beta-helix repeat-containing protein [Phycisphaerales bacterium]